MEVYHLLLVELVRGFGNARHGSGMAMAVGNFDGVHLGHRKLLQELGLAAGNDGLQLAVMTFEPHPLALLRPLEAPARIDDLRGKARKLALSNVKRLHVMHFSHSFAKLSARDFLRALMETCGAKIIAAGSDFRFGAGRTGDIGYLRRVADEAGCHVLEISDHLHGGRRVSSKLVRESVAASQFAKAADLLGVPYEIAGTVVRGTRFGRELGFPTANIRFAHKHALRGVYSGWAVVDGEDALHPCAISAGHRPAVGGGRLVVEAHLIGFDRDLYGSRLALRPVRHLRPERDYPTTAALADAIRKDVEDSVRVLEQCGRALTPP